MTEYLGLPTTQCTYEHLGPMRTGRCFRQTTRKDGRCYYHTEEMLAKRKPRRLSRKKLEALVEKLTQEVDGLKWEHARLSEAYGDLRDLKRVEVRCCFAGVASACPIHERRKKP